MSPSFRTILFKETLENILYLKKQTFSCQIFTPILWIINFFYPQSNSISILSDSSDLDTFKTQTVRSAVNVREGQGVVLLCGPPAHSGGKFYHMPLFVPVFCYSCMTHKNWYQLFQLHFYWRNTSPLQTMFTYALNNRPLMKFIQNIIKPIPTGMFCLCVCFRIQTIFQIRAVLQE